MNTRIVVFLLAIILLLGTTVLIADEHHDHSAMGGEKIGKVHFPISCKAETNETFEHAVALLHSFWYDSATQTFTEVTRIDPECAMGYWGIAMTQYHPLWSPPTPGELEIGTKAAEKAVSMPTSTEREKAYIQAIALFYKDATTVDHRTRAIAYSNAMEKIYQQYPDDMEAAAFYALSLNGTALPSDKTYANQKKAVKILETILAKEPEHPGVYHYIIHSYDYPQLAELALPAARQYAKVAPDSPHALHMPSHIFTRLGLWQESIASNRASADAAYTHVQKKHPGAASFDQLHAMDYLTYAYLQLGEDQAARKVVDEASKMNEVDEQNFAAANAFAAIPARYALERHQWEEAQKINLSPKTFAWDKFPYAEANVHFARAVGAARGGNPDGSKPEIEKLGALRDEMSKRKDQYWAGIIDIQRQEADAWLLKAQGKKDEALQMMQSAVDIEAATEKHPVTPGVVLPASEQLGEMMLECNRPQEALKAFETSLASAPNRFNSLFGAAHAAELGGDDSKAKTYYAKLVALGEHSKRVELAKATAFLGEPVPPAQPKP
jgi:tetratricopeptide (TPR) repeat protein